MDNVARRAWEITAPATGGIVDELIKPPQFGEVEVCALWGAVSVGSERLVYEGRVPSGLPLDETLPALEGELHYPFRYGYILVGEVVACGEGVDREYWLNRRVFLFHPHATRVVVPLADLIEIPDQIGSGAATLYANVETALTLLWDAGVAVGEALVITGGGIVGLLSLLIARRVGAGIVVMVERDHHRRDLISSLIGEHGEDQTPVVCVPTIDRARALLSRYPFVVGRAGFDVAIEVTGDAGILNGVISHLRFGGRVVIGSWYGTDAATLDLGGRFHRDRITIISSQVSSIPPSLRGRFDTRRRTQVVWEVMERLPLQRIARRVVSFAQLGEFFTALSHSGVVEPWVMVEYREDHEEGERHG